MKHNVNVIIIIIKLNLKQSKYLKCCLIYVSVFTYTLIDNYLYNINNINHYNLYNYINFNY